MKNINFCWLAFLLFFTTIIKADYTSPGSGVYFTLDSLVTHSAGAVTKDSINYYFNQSVLIANSDTLLVNSGSRIVFTDVSGNVELDINGAFIANGSIEDSIIITSQNQAPGDYLGLRYRTTGAGSDFQMHYCRIEYAENAVDAVGADAWIENCLFQYTGYTAVDLSQSNSTIKNCVLRRNEQRTIFMTLSSSPLIEGNSFYENNRLNTHPYPFINIGLQGVNSPVVDSNTIMGGNYMSGGIAIWNNSNAVIKNNTIENCGYGILCYQFDANPYIQNNTIRNNTIHPDTLNWGFGIACNGSNEPVVTGNIIEGNYYGVAIINGAQPNVGNVSNSDTTDDGYNQFLGNGIGNNKYELYNQNSLPIYAENNWWGTNNPDSIEARIVHQVDNPTFGLVDFDPFISQNPSIVNKNETRFAKEFELLPAYPNPFNPETNITFILSKKTNLAVTIYDISGAKIKTLLNGTLNPGKFNIKWDGANSSGNRVASGIYLYEVRSGRVVKSGKLILLR